MANLINFLQPECIVVGGTYGRLNYKEFLPQALRLAQKNISTKNKMPKLIISRLKHAGPLGAALMVK